MNEPASPAAGRIGGIFAELSLPRWAELPDLELYMDQVLSLVERYLGSYPGFDGRGLTASMVNNYVKQGAIPAPVKKKYTREHLAHLIMICILKASLPIAAIRQLIGAALESAPPEALYDRFCELFERTGQAVSASVRETENAGEDGSLGAVWSAALRAQAEQALALKLYGTMFPAEDE